MYIVYCVIVVLIWIVFMILGASKWVTMTLSVPLALLAYYAIFQNHGPTQSKEEEDSSTPILSQLVALGLAHIGILVMAGVIVWLKSTGMAFGWACVGGVGLSAVIFICAAWVFGKL